LILDATTDRARLRTELAAIKGIGPWSIAHVEMRGFGDPDVFLDGDLVARRGLAALDLTPADTDRWRPWRSYATRHLWNTVWRP
jgi:AraC family transcriptional regulator of adaptative response / DNA-3-methyladenine glycosylase II